MIERAICVLLICGAVFTVSGLAGMAIGHYLRRRDGR
jgi:hypothetical protein